jgi:outer membrane assembly lipoprotein YfiO
MRWLRIFILLGIVVTLAAAVHAKLVFRDGQWVRVPDDEDSVVEPAPAQAPADQPAPVAVPTKAPAELPAETTTAQPIETPAESPTVPPAEAPADVTVETPSPQPAETPAETTAAQPVETPVLPTTIEPTTQPEPAAEIAAPTPVVQPDDHQAMTPMTPIEPEQPVAAETTTPAPTPETTTPVEPQPSVAETTPDADPPAVAAETPAAVETPATAEAPSSSETAAMDQTPAIPETSAVAPPADDEQIEFVFRDGRWEPVVRSTAASEPATGGVEITPLPIDPEVTGLATELPRVTPITHVRPGDHGPDLPAAIEVEPLRRPALAIDQVPSIGEKYLRPEPSMAADEAEALLADSRETDGAGPEAVRSMIAKFRSGSYSSVARQGAKFLKRNSVSPCGEPASWLRAEAVFADGDYYKAFNAYEHFITNYAGSRLVDKALTREMECAEALFGPARRKILGLGLGSGNDEAVGILERVYAHRPTGPLAAEALFRIGEFKMGTGKFEEAEEQFRRFIDEFPNHNRARQARLMAAQSAIASCLGPQYDIAPMRRAGGILESYQDTYPEMAARENVSGALEAIRRHEASRKYDMASYYDRAGRPVAARFYARAVVDEFPGTPAAVDARKMLQELPPQLAAGR